MMFKIVMFVNGNLIDMPSDNALDLFEACYRVGLYKKRNPDARFRVINNINQDIEYEI